MKKTFLKTRNAHAKSRMIEGKLKKKRENVNATKRS
jgi:hypothetical protein